MNHSKKALLLVNLGTPDSPDTRHVRNFLTEFLNDRRVIDLPWLLQKILVNLIIVPFRSTSKTEQYRRLWTPDGSPLLFYLGQVVTKLGARLKSGYEVFGAMRYGNPSLKAALKKIEGGSYNEIVVFPLFPQYASSTNGSIADFILSEMRKWQNIPALKFIDQYYFHPSFINAYAGRIQKYNPDKFSHIVFSYHGLPVRHINKTHPGVDCLTCTCTMAMTEYGERCYKAACYETTRLLAEKLDLTEGVYTTTFQSRLSRNWLIPFTDETLIRLASTGNRKVLIAAPSFVADCLETTIELGEDYKALFRQNQGEELVLVESLNDNDDWIDAIVSIVR